MELISFSDLERGLGDFLVPCCKACEREGVSVVSVDSVAWCYPCGAISLGMGL